MLCVVSNWSAGRGESIDEVIFAEGLREQGLNDVQTLLKQLF